MKVLLDTNIVIHREASRVINQDIGILFYWIDKLKFTKIIHPVTIEELKRYQNTNAVATMTVKLDNYTVLRNISPTNNEVEKVSKKIDVNTNDKNDTHILNELYCERVDLLISEDKKIHTKAKLLGISEKVYNIDSFLEKVNVENPDLVDYKVLAVKKLDFAQVEIKDSFFNSFREDYIGFDKWFNKKADEVAYVCYSDSTLAAFLYIKIEGEEENYSDINPGFERKKRLKIGTFKVTGNGFKLGERFIKIVFDNALQYKVDEIYVTIFEKRPEQVRLINLLEDWGFAYHGVKKSPNGDEKVFVKNFDKAQPINHFEPKKSFPFISNESKVFLVPIYPQYHTELFPDSILRTESPLNFTENEPHRNALSKVYVSRSYERGLKAGDIIVFYRTGGIYKSVVSTYGIVESVIENIPDEKTFISLCRKRSVYTEEELASQWNYSKNNRPFIVNFIYAHSFRKRPTLAWLIENGIISDVNNAPRGFREISRTDFLKVANYSIGK